MSVRYEVNFYEGCGYIRSLLKDGETSSGVVFNSSVEADGYCRTMNEKMGFKDAERKFLYR
jgi:hypothetical protein